MAQLETSPTTVPAPTGKMLSNERRQAAIARLQEATQPLAIADLAEDLVRAEQGRRSQAHEYDAIQQCALDLRHVYVPKLVELGFVEFDVERQVVSLAG